jgi:hypothetical protein
MPAFARRLLPLLAALALLPAPAAAQVAPRPFSWQLGLTYDLGGEKLMTVGFDDGSSETLRANQGFSFYAGVGVARVHAEKVSLDTSITLGVKGWNIGSSGDTLNYLVFPLEVTERLWAGPFRLGAGLTYLVAPRLSGKGLLAPFTTDLDNSLGFVVQADWIGERKPGRAGGALGLRYAVQSLRFTDSGGSANASTLGFNLGLDF